MPPSFRYERDHPAPAVGVDEAGRGPLAGPVVAAAVILDRRRVPRGIDDSKKLGADAREVLYSRITRVAGWGVGIVDVEEIDRLNIYHATMLAMSRAVDALGVEPGMVLVDGNALPKWRHPGARDRLGRRAVPIDRRGFDCRQGDARPDDDRA